VRDPHPSLLVKVRSSVLQRARRWNLFRLSILPAALAASLLLVAACGDEDDDGDASTTAAAATSEAPASSAAPATSEAAPATSEAEATSAPEATSEAEATSEPEATSEAEATSEPETSTPPTPVADTSNLDVDLSQVCPKKLTLQIDWFPESEYGIYFSMIGPNGKLDKGKGTYTGPLGNTGIELEIRAGGPFIGQETVQSLMFQDDAIDLGLVHTDDAVRFSKVFPTMSVVAPLEHSPLALMWDPEKHDFTSFEDIGASDAKILVFTKAVNYVPFLIKKGIVPEANFDDSFDGSFARFIADPSIVQQGFITNEPWLLENKIDEWKRPVDFLMVADSGYDPYLSSLSVKKERLEELRPCLEKLVPIVQQQQINYLADPGPTNDVLVDVVTKMGTFWALYPDGLADANKKMLEYEIVSNGTDETLGNFVPERVQQVIDDFQATFGTDVDTADPDVTPDSIVTDEFIDPNIHL
jgi:hypothetical protein